VDKLKQRLDTCRQALTTLHEALQMPFSVIVRDGTIQRFEYSFESMWKLLKHYLAEREGIICNSPKSCFRQALKGNLLSVEEVETCLVMTDARNLTSHTYIEEVAEKIYQKLPLYAQVMQKLLNQIGQQLDGERQE
jgi:nucleotidyltransferase substrate binding protein (TIGR01987 family)